MPDYHDDKTGPGKIDADASGFHAFIIIIILIIIMCHELGLDGTVSALSNNFF
jgi:hypothetical protein